MCENESFSFLPVSTESIEFNGNPSLLSHSVKCTMKLNNKLKKNDLTFYKANKSKNSKKKIKKNIIYSLYK